MPAARSVDTLLAAYLDLIGRLRGDGSDEVRRADLDVLAGAVGLDAIGIENRLRRLRLAV